MENEKSKNFNVITTICCGNFRFWKWLNFLFISKAQLKNRYIQNKNGVREYVLEENQCKVWQDICLLNNRSLKSQDQIEEVEVLMAKGIFEEVIITKGNNKNIRTTGVKG